MQTLEYYLGQSLSVQLHPMLQKSCRNVLIRYIMVRRRQCDQMVKLLIQYLAIYNNEHLPNTIKMAKVGSKIGQK